MKEDLGTFPMSALAAEQTHYDYHELIEITCISWHHSPSRQTICGTWCYALSKLDVEDNIHVASPLHSSAQVLLLVPHTRTFIRQRLLSGWSAWNDRPVALHLTPVGHSTLCLSGLKTTLLYRGWGWKRS